MSAKTSSATKRLSKAGEVQPRPRGVKSIEIGIKILSELAASDGPLHLRELAAKCSMTSSKVYGYLVGFVAAEMVEQNPSTGRYELGQLCVEFGKAALRRVAGLEVAMQALAEVVSRVGRDGVVTVWTEKGPVVVGWKQGSDEFAINLREGVLLPLTTTATGRSWARHLHIEAWRSLAREETKAEAKRDRAQAESLFRRHIERIASIEWGGLSFSSGERRKGIVSLSAPIFDASRMRFAVTLLGTEISSDFRFQSTAAAELLSVTRAAGRSLGA